ncbi:tail fiber protein [uncultured Mediterranean phage uvMED]|nr:tail fiber protein [uncultured Mediterranean phage uvMED]BAR17559.1 tail fiber [uncultured Mediterranean phage uvMED]
MTILTAKNTPRVTYTASGSQTAFTIPFEFFSTSDIKVYNGTTLLTYEATPSAANKYSISGTASASDSAYEFGAGGTVTLGGSGATAGDIITIIRDISIERSTDFPTTGSFDITSLNTDLDKVYAKLADIDQQSDRSVKLLDTDSIAATVTLPAKATRASKVLTFDSDGDVQTTIAATDVTTIAGISSDVTTVSGIASNVTSVVSNASNINTVAGAISNVNTVAGISSSVSSVAGVASLITSDFVSDLNTLATTDIVSDLNLLATSDFVSDLNSLATTDFVSDLNALEAIKANVNTVASSISDVNTFASVYRIGSSDPSSSLDEGDLFYNSDSNLLKFYNGSAWVSISDASSLITVADESTDTSCNVLFTTGATGNLAPKSGTNLTFNSSSGALTATSFVGALTGNVTGNTSGSSGSTTGNAATATALETARNIGGVSFDGTGNIDLAGVNTAGNQNTSGTAAGLSATLGVSSGGTGATSLTANGALIGNGTGAVTSVDMSTKGHLLAGDGSGNPSTLSVGTNTHVLTADSSEATGLKWAAAAAAGATGAGGDEVFVENERVVTTNYTLSTNKSAMCVGPLTINTGVTVTIPSGERLVIL